MLTPTESHVIILLLPLTLMNVVVRFYIDWKSDLVMSKRETADISRLCRLRAVSHFKLFPKKYTYRQRVNCEISERVFYVWRMVSYLCSSQMIANLRFYTSTFPRYLYRTSLNTSASVHHTIRRNRRRVSTLSQTYSRRHPSPKRSSKRRRKRAFPRTPTPQAIHHLKILFRPRILIITATPKKQRMIKSPSRHRPSLRRLPQRPQGKHHLHILIHTLEQLARILPPALTRLERNQHQTDQFVAILLHKPHNRLSRLWRLRPRLSLGNRI